MTTLTAPTNSAIEEPRLREEWLGKLSILVESVEKWSEELG